MAKLVDFLLNGRRVRSEIGAHDTLLTLLRKARRTGLVRSACAPPGSCAHCVVNLDGIPTLACLVRPEAVAGRKVEVGADQNQPFLVQYSGSQLGRKYTVSKETMVVGRMRTCDIRLTDPSVSRMHARLRAGEKGIVLENLSNSNGTHVNFNRVTTHMLRHGDMIAFGTALMKFRERLDLESAIQDMLYKMATTDQLTQVLNRRFMIDELDRAVGHYKSAQVAVSIILFDLDYFKSVNDRYGHNAGDTVLKTTARVIEKMVRPQDVFGRLGGEEFLVILPETPGEEALAIAERCRKGMEEKVFELDYDKGGKKHHKKHKQTISLGVSELNPQIRTRDDFLAAADLCLYRAKETGRNKACFTPLAVQSA